MPASSFHGFCLEPETSSPTEAAEFRVRVSGGWRVPEHSSLSFPWQAVMADTVGAAAARLIVTVTLELVLVTEWRTPSVWR